ncbi:hypothetical protein ACFV0Z_02815 [Streptomyces xiamenensis]|uniref:hypothetical protein n=1 Tax=Streptomyces xiamenensis TaxID=408015 RepID=UPI0036BBAA70
MVGLFWITEESVHLGAEPIGPTSGVRLTEDGVQGLGNAPDPSWSWDEVRRVEIRDVKVRSVARRRVALTLGALYAAVTGDADEPPSCALRVEAADRTAELSFYASAIGGIYSPAEFALSRTLLDRIAGGGTRVGDLLAWRREQADDTTPPPEEREALLRMWAGGQAY